MNNYDFLIIGAGVFGITTAIELHKRHYKVGILNSGAIPDPLAASTDISKIVRMEYGSDVEYARMAELSIAGWQEWNELLGEELYHETGFLLLCKKAMEAKDQAYEMASYQHMLEKGYPPKRMSSAILAQSYPAFQKDYYQDGFFNPKAGYVESGRAIQQLANYARQLGVTVLEGQRVEELVKDKDGISAVRTRGGESYKADHFILCAGAHTPYLLPELQSSMRVTGHPVFHLKPKDPDLFRYPQFTVFAADISNTGWYGFPLHPKEQVIKIANHGKGLELHPDHDERLVTADDERKLRAFLQEALPALADAPVVHTRRCLYTDILDGHYWIDRHPQFRNLTVGTGGSGHGMKMGPVLGVMIADMAERGHHSWSKRYDWRDLKEGVAHEEEARGKD